MARTIILLAMLLALGAGGPGYAQLQPGVPDDTTTEHQVRQGDRMLRYRATAGMLPLRDAKGDVKAQVFHVAYRLVDAAPRRPVTFVFNGGPGAAAVYLHLGALGPRVIRFPADGGMPQPPAEIEDNPDSWLAFTDLVFVDPVGTGYSRAADAGDEGSKPFWGVRQDLDANAAFIRLWMARSGQADAPLFIAGESYGGFRAAALPALLQNDRGLSPAGVVLISPVLDFSLITENEYRLLPWAVRLPSYAAAALEAAGEPAESLPERLAEVERFALGDFLVALASGPRDPAVADRLYDTVARQTGLPRDIVARHRARIPVSAFVKELRRGSTRLSSRYDASVTGLDPFPSSLSPRGGDPVLRPSVPAFATAFTAYAWSELGWRTDRDYRVLAPEPGRAWDWRSGIEGAQGFVGVTDELRTAMAQNPRLQVLIAHGYTDLITPYMSSRYLVEAMPPVTGRAPIVFRTYPGGHMMYSRAGSRRLLAQDAAALYRAALAP